MNKMRLCMFLSRILGCWLHRPNPLGVDITDLDVTTNGSDLAFGHFIIHISRKKTDGSAMDYNARVTYVYQKLNGKWLIVHEHVSLPMGMSTGKPEFHSKP